jgi:hypothetical protein
MKCLLIITISYSAPVNFDIACLFSVDMPYGSIYVVRRYNRLESRAAAATYPGMSATKFEHAITSCAFCYIENEFCGRKVQHHSKSELQPIEHSVQRKCKEEVK